jgi:tRNA(Ile)-lysidine synthase
VARALERLAICRSESIVIALSGGPDSVALLHALRELQPRFGYRLAAAHLNHGMRGAESDRDEAFVRDLCATLGAELIVEHARDLNSSSGGNLEERAREARYEFLARAAKRIGASRIATAHHADDQAETVMLRLLRGTGVSGLAAIPESSISTRDGTAIIRPMLSVWREEILAWLEARGAHFVIDSSNASYGFLRNRLRRELLPAVERGFAPGLRRRLAALAGEVRELDDFVAQAARAELDRCVRNGVLELECFTRLHPALASAVIRAFVTSRTGNLRGFSRRHLDALRQLCLARSPSATLDLPRGWCAERRGARLGLEHPAGGRRRRESAAEEFAVVLAREGVTVVPQAQFVFDSTMIPADSAALPADLFEACFDADQTKPGLVVRNFIRGDRIAPLGMKGRRKLHDIFIDHKLPHARRSTFPVVTLNGEIAWLPGMARARIALIKPETGRVLRLRAQTIMHA